MNQRNKLKLSILMLILGLILTVANSGCGHRLFNRGQVRIDARRSRSELWGAYNDAASKLGMVHKGGTIRVEFRVGKEMSNVPPWRGASIPNQFEGVSLGHFNPTSQKMIIYTTNGKFRYETARWEMGRAILSGHGIFDRWEQERILIQAGFR